MRRFTAKPTWIDGHRFASKAEAKRYAHLMNLTRVGIIRDLVLQERFDLVVNGVKIGFYKADFSYTVDATDQRVVEDVKARREPVFVIKKKLVKALHGVTIQEVDWKSYKAISAALKCAA